MFLMLVIGLLLYGRNLPDAGRSLGRVIAQLKRSFHDFKNQLDRDGELGDVKQALKDTAREMKSNTKVPRAMSNPSDALRDLTNEAMSSSVDDDDDGELDDVKAPTQPQNSADTKTDKDESSTPSAGNTGN